MIQLDFKDPRPIYEQIKDKIKGLIINGVLKADEKIPSVRELAQELTINPNTIQKAYKDLEGDGLIYSVKGKGNFIAPVNTDLKSNRRNELFNQMNEIVKELIFFNTSKQQVIDKVNEIFKQEEAEK
jgi:GntR family transcriptional regulator